jgi:hypothetical protein
MIRDFARALVFVLAFLIVVAEFERLDESNVPEWSHE